MLVSGMEPYTYPKITVTVSWRELVRNLSSAMSLGEGPYLQFFVRISYKFNTCIILSEIVFVVHIQNHTAHIGSYLLSSCPFHI